MCRVFLNIVLWVLFAVISGLFGSCYGSNKTENVTVTETVVSSTTESVDLNVTEFSINVTARYENESSVNESTTEEIITTTSVPNVIVSSKESDLEICTCDVTSVTCDINCCCDRDCSVADRTAFMDCDAVDKIQGSLDSRYCFKEIPFFRNNTPYKMIETSNDLFCIYKDNLAQRFKYKDPPVITNAVKFDNILEEHADNVWFSTPVETDENNFLVETLKVGSPVYVKDEDGKIGYLVLPRSLTSGLCNTKNPMSYMTDQTFKCYQHLANQNLESDCTTNRWLNGNFYYENFKVAKTSASFKRDSNSTEADDFLDVTPQLCVDTFQGAVTSCNYSTVHDPLYENGTCYGAVSKALYVIEHNGTEGLLNVEVHLTLGDIPATSNNIWMQEHGVSFRWPSVNSTNDTMTFRRSGNPGYLMGAPVIAGKLVTRDVNGKRTAVELDPDPRSWLTVMMPSASGNGQCIWESGSMGSGFNRVPIGFGHNLRTGCLVVVSSKNLTEMCQLIQGVALDALHGWDPPTVVAAYGNPKVENPGEWVPILRENQPSVLRSSYEDLSCTNIVRELDIHILYANIGAFSNPQPKIIGVRFRYGNAGQLKIRCKGYYCLPGSEELTQSFTVTATVSFVDLSEKAVPMYAEPPTIDIQLPYDFFYPFHATDCATNSKLQPILYFVILLINFLLITGTHVSVFN